MSLKFNYRALRGSDEMNIYRESYMREDEFKLVCNELYKLTTRDFLRICDKLSDDVEKIERGTNLTSDVRDDYIKYLVEAAKRESDKVWEKYHRMIERFTDDYKNRRIVVEYYTSSDNLID